MSNYFKKQNIKQIKSQAKGGYAILFTVVIISVILTIALGMSNVAYKELILSSVARDSQTAFYQADTSAECALYADLVIKISDFQDLASQGLPAQFKCGKDNNDNDIILDFVDLSGSSGMPIFTFQPNILFDITNPCFDIYIDKSRTPENTIDSKGYNTCNKVNPRTVERAIEVFYQTP